MIALEATEVSVTLGTTRALQGVSVAVAAGEWLALVGPNGAGKSTLLRVLGGLHAHGGAVCLRGVALRTLGRRAVAREVALVSQDPLTPPDMTVSEYVLLGRTPHLGYLGREGRRDREVVERVLMRLDLLPFCGRRLGTLSGGERQRAVLARALAQEAPVLLLDEPTSALDIGRQQQVLDLVRELRRERGLTVVAAMHDLTLAGHYAERLVLLDRGRVVATGPPSEVLTEELIQAHYGARVRVLVDGAGRAVIPWRDDPLA